MTVDTTPASGGKVALIDFDATIAPWGPLFKQGPPHPEVRAALTALKDAGYRIVIFTSRMSQHWLKAEFEERGYFSAASFASANATYVMEYLDRYGIPFDEITADKRPAEVYFDDKAVRVTSDTLAEEVFKWLEDRGVS